jgi:ribonuclease HI
LIRSSDAASPVDLEVVIIAHFDGSCDPNPGGRCAFGFVVWRDGRLLQEGRGLAAPPGPGATNNVAEYTGCIRALEWLRYENRREPMVLRGDSELVMKQVKGVYQVRSPLLAPLYGRVRELLPEFSALRLEWIPREQNVEADRLASSAL